MPRNSKAYSIESDKNRLIKEHFINALAEGNQVLVACRIVKLPFKSAYRLRESDPEFAKQWDIAIEYSKQDLDTRAFNRAKYARKDSPTGFQYTKMVLQANLPEKYKERLEVNQTFTIDWDSLPEQIVDGFLAKKLTLQDVYEVQSRIRSGAPVESTQSEGTTGTEDSE